MNIVIHFRNGSDYWRSKVTANAAQVSRILSDPRFLELVRAWPAFDHTEVTPPEIAETLRTAGSVEVRVGFYSKWWTRAIAYEDASGVYFNTRKERQGAGGIGNIAHEVCHSLGFSHAGNSPAGQENTVPWRIGGWVETWHP